MQPQVLSGPQTPGLFPEELASKVTVMTGLMFLRMSQAPQQLLGRNWGLGSVCWLIFKADRTGIWATFAADHLPGDLSLALGQRPAASHWAWVRREAGTHSYPA